jgi:hypothetical protein
MHIAVISHHRLPVKGYGGTERIVVALVRGLVELGHRVTLIAAPGQAARAIIVELPSRRLGIKLRSGSASAPGRRRGAPLPSVYCATGPRSADDLRRPETGRGHARRAILSRNHAGRHGSTAFVYAGSIRNSFSDEAPDFFIGRLHSAKGYHWAIEGAKRTNRRLMLAGGWRPSFSTKIRFVGEVDGKKKAELLAGARCLWMPALWDEPFGLTTIEALFSGTPVLGTKPEVLTGEVGALCDTLDEMVEASRTIAARKPESCRAHAERYFTHRVMAEGYVRMYQHLREAGALPVGVATPWSG